MLTVPENLFIGYQKQPDETKAYPGGDICPNEKARAARIKGITGRTATQMVVNNNPLPGFTLLEPGSSWHGKRDYWGIIDPRGFKFTISGDNLARIMACTGITQGLIQERCVWGYDSGELILLPANSEPYLEATKNSDILSKRVYMRDLQLGDTVMTHKKVQAVYMGTWRTFWQPMWTSATIDYNDSNKRVLFRVLDDFNNITGYYLTSTVKISEIVNKVDTPLTAKEVFEELNLAQGVGLAFTENDKFDKKKIVQSWCRPAFFTKDNKKNVAIDLREVDYAEFKTEFDRTTERNIKTCYVMFPPDHNHPDGFLCSASDYCTGGMMTSRQAARLPNPDVAFDVVTDFNKESGKVRLHYVKSTSRYSNLQQPDRLQRKLTECEKYFIIERTFDNHIF